MYKIDAIDNYTVSMQKSTIYSIDEHADSHPNRYADSYVVRHKITVEAIEHLLTMRTYLVISRYVGIHFVCAMYL